jgi:hypothetical protein
MEAAAPQIESEAQRDGRGLTRVLTMPFLRDTAYDDDLVLEHQQQQLDFPEACCCAAPDQGKRQRSVKEAAWTVHHNTYFNWLSHSPPARQVASVLGHLSSLRPHW